MRVAFVNGFGGRLMRFLRREGRRVRLRRLCACYLLDLPGAGVVHGGECLVAGRDHAPRVAQQGGAGNGHLGEVDSVDLGTYSSVNNYTKMYS